MQSSKFTIRQSLKNSAFTFRASGLGLLPSPFRRRQIASFIAAALLIFAMTGCREARSIAINAAGHPITLEVVGEHFIEGHAERGTIQSRHGTVVIESTRMRLEDGKWTAIEAGIPVKVQMAPGRVILVAGRVSVERTVN